MYKKYALISTVAAMVGMGLLLMPSDAQEGHCVSEWSNPQTGDTECLEASVSDLETSTQLDLPVAKVSDGEDLTVYLDHLKTCQTYFTEVALPVWEGISVRSTIQGWSGERCGVQTSLMAQDNSGGAFDYMVCDYSRDTLALLTDEIAYQQAQNGEVEIAIADARSKMISDAMLKECTFSEGLDQAFSLYSSRQVR